MTIEELIQYCSMGIAVILLIVKNKGMKKYIPVAMFASLYANIWCYIAKYFDFWKFPSRIFPFVEDISIPVNMVVVPIIAMFWVRYYPTKTSKRIFWYFIWSTALIITEIFIERFTDLLEYSKTFKWYHSYFLWFISFYIWRRFHLWLLRV